MLSGSIRMLLLTLLFAAFPVTAAEPVRPRLDAFGDPLPPGALARLGTVRFRVEGRASLLDLSPDGKLAAVLLPPNLVVVLEAATGKERSRFRTNRAPCSSLSFTPDSKRLVLVAARNPAFAADGKMAFVSDGLEIRDLEGKVVCQLDQERDPGARVSFSDDGKRLAVLTGTNRSPAVWDVAANKQLAAFGVPYTSTTGVALSGDGRLLASWGESNNPANHALNQTVCLASVDTGKELRRIRIRGRYVVSAMLSPDGKQLAIVEYGPLLTLWNVARGEQVCRLGPGSILRYSPDGKRLIGLTAAGAVQFWEASTGKLLATVQTPPTANLISAAFPAADKGLAMALDGNAERCWEVPGGKERTPSGLPTRPITCLGFSPDGRLLHCGGVDGIRCWETATGLVVRPYLVRANERYQLAGTEPFISPNAKYAAWGGGRTKVSVLELVTGKTLYELEADSYMRDFAFSVDSTALVTLSYDSGVGRLRVWEPATGRLQFSQQTPPAKVFRTAALSPGGRLVAVAVLHNDLDPGQPKYFVSVYDAVDGKELFRLLSIGRDSLLAFSPDGSLLAATDSAGTVRIWDMEDGAQVRQLTTEKKHPIRGLAFSPDGRTLAVAYAGFDEQPGCGKVVVFEVASGQARAEFSGHRGDVTALAYSPDGHLLATGSDDTTVVLWDLAGRLEDIGPRGRRSPEELNTLWSDLKNGDARQAHRTMLDLRTTPRHALTLLSERLTAPSEDRWAQEVERLIAELDSDDFEVREKASRALAAARKVVRRALVRALEEKPSAEKKRRLDELLAVSTGQAATPELLRQTRALEVLERLDTPEARELLRKLSRGHPDRLLTSEARETLRRLERLDRVRMR